MDRTFWFNMRTREVEQGPQSPSLDIVGPFDTAEEAARAPELLAERSKAWEEDEQRERDWPSDEA